jgi:hypothetical protein
MVELSFVLTSVYGTDKVEPVIIGEFAYWCRFEVDHVEASVPRLIIRMALIDMRYRFTHRLTPLMNRRVYCE